MTGVRAGCPKLGQTATLLCLESGHLNIDLSSDLGQQADEFSPYIDKVYIDGPYSSKP